MSLNVMSISKSLMYDPIKVLLKNSEVAVDLISQFYLDVESEELKFDTLLDLYTLVSTSQAIIFCNTIRKVEWLEQNLTQNNFPITVIHSNMTQEKRDSVVNEFREGKTRLLLTTDLLSRGIDIQQVGLIINYDIPRDPEEYIHRVGRSGRFGKVGVAVTFVIKRKRDDKIKKHHARFISTSPYGNSASAFAVSDFTCLPVGLYPHQSA